MRWPCWRRRTCSAQASPETACRANRGQYREWIPAGVAVRPERPNGSNWVPARLASWQGFHEDAPVGDVASADNFVKEAEPIGLFRGQFVLPLLEGLTK